MKHGRVIATAAKGVWVATSDSEGFYKFQGKNQKTDIYPCALGDRVKVDPGQQVILEIQDRPNILIRVRNEKSPQPLLSHVSLVCVMVCFVRGKFPTQFVDRVVTGVKQQHIPIEVIISKKDLLTEDQASWARRYADYMAEYAGTRVHILNAKDPKDAGLFLQMIRFNEELPVVGFLGPSGTGKTTFLERVTGSKLETTPVNQKTEKGRHTTSQPQLYSKGKWWFGDLPGIKTWYPSTEGLINYFTELITLAGTLRCDLPGCRHVAPRNKDCLLARLWKFSPDEGARAFAKLRYQSYEAIMTDDNVAVTKNT